MAREGLVPWACTHPASSGTVEAAATNPRFVIVVDDASTSTAASPVLQASDLEAARPVLLRVCYRMLGGLADAEDAVQETMIRAWRAADSFAGRSSLQTWLCRIATRVCLDQLGKRKRTLPTLLGPAGTIDDELTTSAAESWVEPVPDAWWVSGASRPDQLVQNQEAIRLAYVAALQRLSPKQRASLILLDVVGLSAVEAAAALETSTASVNSALQRARRVLATEEPAPPPLDENAKAVLDEFMVRFEAYDLDGLAKLLREDTTMCMPPFRLWLRGADAITGWMGGRGAGCAGSRVVPTRANGGPAFGQYRVDPAGGYVPWALVVPEASGGAISALHFFLDTATLFPRFGLPPRLD